MLFRFLAGMDIQGFPVEKFYRDSKLCTIGEGTSEIQKLVISREIMKGNI